MKRPLAFLVVLAALGAITSPVGAAPIAGPNGPIVLTSGRDDGLTAFDNTHAQIWISTSVGASPQRVTSNATIQHRHATWSPDRTKIAYSAGDSTIPDFDIWILDLTQPLSGTNPKDITNNPGISDDRPAWSPDGTKIAYATKVAGVKNIYIQNANGPQIAQLTNNSSANQDVDRPAWSPDSQTIFYSIDVDATVAVNNDIYKAPATATLSAGTQVVTGPSDDYHPAVSPDGQSLCYNEGAFGTTGAFVERSTVAGASQASVASSGQGDYNCTWSPDGTKIAYVQGIFGFGDLVMRNSDGTGSVTALVPNSGNPDFDGNPEWAPNPSPTCNNASAKITPNTFATVPLTCSDEPDPPSFQDNSVQSVDIVSPPKHGVLSAVIDDKSVIYTPNKDFQGTDTFTYNATDGNSDSKAATVTVTVANPSSGDKTAPNATLSGSTKQNLAKQKAVVVSITPNEASALTASGSVSVPGASRSFKLGGASANAAANAKVKLRLKISAKGVRAIRKAVRKHKRVKASVTIVAKDGAGNAATFKRTVRAKAK